MVSKEGGWDKIIRRDEEQQTSSYKINKPWGCNTEYKEYGRQFCNKFVWGQMVTRLSMAIIP